MKRLLISTLLGVLSMAAIAQTEPESAVQIHGHQIQLPDHPYRMFRGDFDDYKGRYDLSNGEQMTLLSRGHRMYAVIGDRPLTEMVAASAKEFVAVDRQFKMKLDQQWGEMSGELWLEVPSRSSQANAQGFEVIRLLTSR